MRVKMIVAYDGTNYKGWQVQPNGITIEEVLNKNLSNLLGEQIVVSRTFRMPTRRLDTYFYHYPLDVEKMKKAASYLEGEHDFKSFCAIGAQVKTTVRTIYACDVEKEGDIITIRVTGNGFLYNMVRIIAGTLVQVGGGAIEPEAVKEILAKKDRSAAGPTAPAHGLTMMGIEFENVE